MKVRKSIVFFLPDVFNSKELTDWKDETRLIPVWIKCSHAAGGYAMLYAVEGVEAQYRDGTCWLKSHWPLMMNVK